MASEAGGLPNKTLPQMAAPAQFRCMPTPNLPQSASPLSDRTRHWLSDATPRWRVAAPPYLRFVWPRRS
eukprot:4146749-Pleurochrysis_carterae.AAC.1